MVNYSEGLIDESSLTAPFFFLNKRKNTPKITIQALTNNTLTVGVKAILVGDHERLNAKGSGSESVGADALKVALGDTEGNDGSTALLSIDALGIELGACVGEGSAATGVGDRVADT